ncbi:MAG: hypothetical protein WCA05_21315, partial [Pseudolabrys sp.]
AVVMTSMSGPALAQSNMSQSPRLAQSNMIQSPRDMGTTTGITGRQAPVGHRQPTTKDLPPDVLQNEQRATPSDKKADKKTTICKGC